jgi:hypothetical protein
MAVGSILMYYPVTGLRYPMKAMWNDLLRNSYIGKFIV